VYLLVTTLRAVSLVSGSIMVFAALFLRESEERAVENILVDWWVRIDDLQRALLSRHLAFLRVSAAFATKVLDGIFGRAILSIRATCVSGALSFLSMYLFVPVAVGWAAAQVAQAQPLRTFDEVARLLKNPSTPVHFVIVYALWAAVPPGLFRHVLAALAACGVTAGIAHTQLRNAPVVTWIIGAALLSWLFWAEHPPGLGARLTATIYIDGVIIGTLCDFVTVAAVRRLLRVQECASRLRVIILSSTCQVLLAVSLVVPLAVTGIRLCRRGDSISFIVGSELLLAASSNMFGATMCLSLGVAAAALAAHRVLWPLIERPLYALARFGLYRTAARRGALFTFGAGLLAIAADGSGSALAAAAKFLVSG